MSNILRGVRNSGLPLRDPNATCAACGAIGTVGRIVRKDAESVVLEVHRYCRACWPVERAQFQARRDQEWQQTLEAMRRDSRPVQTPEGGYEIGGATWDGVLDLIRDIETARHDTPRPSRTDLASLCDHWPELEIVFEEPMPQVVRAFYDAHRSGAS